MVDVGYKLRHRRQALIDNVRVDYRSKIENAKTNLSNNMSATSQHSFNKDNRQTMQSTPNCFKNAMHSGKPAALERPGKQQRRSVGRLTMLRLANQQLQALLGRDFGADRKQLCS